MSYNVLGISIGHNSSAALVSNGELVYYLEEERLSREKRDGNPFRAMVDICSKYKIDKLVIGGTNDQSEHNTMPWTGYNPWVDLIRKYNPNLKVIFANAFHHKLHTSCAFYNSGFNKASILIIDGAGSLTNHKDGNISWECESLWEGVKNNLKLINKSSYSPIKTIIGKDNLDSSVTITKTYEAVTVYLGWQGIEGGKTMGLAPYGKQNPNIPQLFKNGRGDRNIFQPHYPAGARILENNYSIFHRNHNPKDWHTDPSKLTEIEADLAWQIQNDTQEEVAKLIEKSVELTGNTQICIAGGYGLNCVTNYWLKKRFPNLEIYHEAISHDGGTAIGAAYLGWIEYQPQTKFSKQTSIYYGPKYSKGELLEGIKKYVDTPL